MLIYRQVAVVGIHLNAEPGTHKIRVEHADGSHTLHIGQAATAYGSTPEGTVDYYEGAGIAFKLSRWERRTDFRCGEWSHTDYDFENPSTDLLVSAIPADRTVPRSPSRRMQSADAE